MAAALNTRKYSHFRDQPGNEPIDHWCQFMNEPVRGVTVNYDSLAD